MKEEKWKTLIRQKLQDYEETPPPELWNYGAQNEVYNDDWVKSGLIVLYFS